jgi:hypothetical protein
MTEMDPQFRQSLPGNALSQTDNGEAQRETLLADVRQLDPELLERASTRPLVEMGAQFQAEVTAEHGTPDRPRWYVGTVEERPMTYHNGGEDGHTSTGERGIGVPRAVLLISAAVNHAAGREVYSPVERATAFDAGCAHDRDQNCGRALLPEGRQGEGYGDERLSAERVRDQIRDLDPATAAQLPPNTADRAYDDVMATAFNPETKTQDISYEAWLADPNNEELQHAVLGQELLGAADLLSLTHPRGPVGSVENIVEIMASNVSERMLQVTLQAREISTTGEVSMEQILDVIGEDDTLRAKFTELMGGQSGFFTGFRYSDRVIRAACGQGIDDLFPGRAENATVLVGFTDRLRNGTISPREVWQEARTRAGYQD